MTGAKVIPPKVCLKFSVTLLTELVTVLIASLIVRLTELDTFCTFVVSVLKVSVTAWSSKYFCRLVVPPVW